MKKMSFVKKNLIFKEKSGTIAKVKLVTKIEKHNQLYSGTLVLLSYCYQGSHSPGKSWKVLEFE